MNLQAATVLYAGGPGSGCSGPNCGRPKVGTTPDHTGKIPVPADIARNGASLADSLQKASQRFDWAEREKSQLGYTKSGQRRTGPKFRREIEEAQKKSNVASKAYRDESTKSQAFEKENGIHPVQAWEAHHDRDWPNYKINTSGKGRTHYVPKEEQK